MVCNTSFITIEQVPHVLSEPVEEIRRCKNTSINTNTPFLTNFLLILRKFCKINVNSS